PAAGADGRRRFGPAAGRDRDGAPGVVHDDRARACRAAAGQGKAEAGGEAGPGRGPGSEAAQAHRDRDRAGQAAQAFARLALRLARRRRPLRDREPEGHEVTAAALRPDAILPLPERQQSMALTYHRLMLAMLVFAGVTMVIASRLLYLQVFTDRSGAAEMMNPLIPTRGDLVDRNGMPLARNIDAWSIAIHPNKLLTDPKELAGKLAELMPEKTEAEYLAMLTSGKSFAYLSRRAVPELVAAVNALGEPAVEFGREPERLYPQTGLAGHVLGWTMDGRGVAGMERVLDARLSDPSARATPVALSIDTRVQAVMESELAAAMAKFSAIGAAGLVLDIQTGEVIAMTSLPSLN